jgi:hypothetical protein
MAEKKKPVKPEKPVTLGIKVPGKKTTVTHKVSKSKKGDVVVEHTNTNQGKYDKINLTKMGGSKTVQQGVKAVQKWHKSNPHKSQGK